MKNQTEPKQQKKTPHLLIASENIKVDFPGHIVNVEIDAGLKIHIYMYI